MFALDTPNIVGTVALIMTVTALTRRSNNGLLAILGLSVFLWSAHYALLGSLSGAAVHLVAAFGLFAAHWMQSTGVVARGVTGALFSAIGVGCSVYFGSGWADVLAGVGCVVITLSQFLGKGNTMRVGFMCGETIFFGFAFLVGSSPGMAVTAGNFLAGVVGLVRRGRALKSGLVID